MQPSATGTFEISPSEQAVLAAYERHPHLVAFYRVNREADLRFFLVGMNGALRRYFETHAPTFLKSASQGVERGHLARDLGYSQEFRRLSEELFRQAVEKNDLVTSEYESPIKPGEILLARFIPVTLHGSVPTHLCWIAKNLRDEVEAERKVALANINLEKQVEKQTAILRAALLKAEAATQVKSDFLSRISHELRTPMHAIISFAALGKDPQMAPPLEKMQGYFENIHRAGGQMVEMLSDLLDFSKLESRRMSFEFRKTRIRDLTIDVLEALRELAEKRSQTLNLKCPLDLTAHVDGMRLSQVIRNLVSNAIKYGNPNMEIEVVWQAEPNLTLQVLDRGPGIPAGEEESIFEMFTQSSSTRNQGRGTGLGLAISREIAKAHGGTITAAPRDGGGSTFTLTLGDPQMKGA